MGKLFEKLCQGNCLHDAWYFVRTKNSSGGIDGMSVSDFDKKAKEYVTELTDALKSGKWMPLPYKSITIPKNQKERRNIGLLSIKDKIVQTAIKLLVEPKFERIFLNNSYGYRPGKGHNKAVRRTIYECQNSQRNWFVKLDIDDYFDTIRHDILSSNLYSFIKDEEIVRLMMLCMKMGRVNSKMKWQDITSGVPQGAVLSPLLSNFYLHPFDKFVVALSVPYIRYADDFVIICDSKEQAESLLKQTSEFLTRTLSLSLNQPIIGELSAGFDFLGVNISKSGIGLSERKREDIKAKIDKFDLSSDGLNLHGQKTWAGFHRYYKDLLSQPLLLEVDELLHIKLKSIIEKCYKVFLNQSVLKQILEQIDFLSDDYGRNKKKIIRDLLNLYASKKAGSKGAEAEKQNEKIISKRKKEYQKRENENRELVVNTNGSTIGLTKKGITIKQQGKIIFH